jgi:hypothetical protein
MSSKIEEIAIESGHALHDGEARRRSRRLAPGVIGVCLVMVLASSLALVLVPRAGAVPGPPYATVKVPCGASIQTAINAAHSGDTIVVAKCTYTEQLTISKSITIIGAGAGKTIIQSPAVLKPDAFGNPWTIELGSAATVSLSGFTLVVTPQCIIYPGPAPYIALGFVPIPTLGYAGGGIGVGGSAFLSLHSAVVTTTGAAEGAACGGPSPTTAGLLSYGTGVGFGLDYLAGSPPAVALVGSGTVSWVSISGFGFDGAGVLVGGGYDSPAGSYAYISNDQISTGADDTNGCTGSYSGISGPAIGLGLGVNAESATIVDNTISGQPGCANAGIAVYFGSSAYIAHNSIIAGTYGVGVLVGIGSSSATIIYNSITAGTTYEGYAGIYVEVGGSATVSYNSIGNFECEYNATYVAFGACGPSLAYQFQATGIINDNYLGLGTVVETNNLFFNIDAGIAGAGGCSSCIVKDNVMVNVVDYGILGIDGSFFFGPNLIEGGMYGVGATAYYADTAVTLDHVLIIDPSVAPFYYENDNGLPVPTIGGTYTVIG